MTAAERRERGTLLCRQLTEAVAKVAPDGIGGWDRAWGVVAAADAAFLAALTAWEASGAEDDKPALRDAYRAVLDAWRQAVAMYRVARSQLDTEKKGR